MLEAEIVKARQSTTVEATLRVGKGAALGLFGPSGAGKSTVLACIAGIEQPDRGLIQLGEIRLFPPPLPLNRRPLGYLTQEASLFPHLTVGQNVCFGLPNGGPPGDQQRWVTELRERLELGPLWRSPATRISGGQARRVALARMLARRPRLVLLDEPFSGLDRGAVRTLIDDLLAWSKSLGFSMIAVDHQAENLQRLTPRAVVMEAGKIVQEGSWEELCSCPATSRLRELLSPL